MIGLPQREPPGAYEGWRVVATWDLDTGDDAEVVEEGILEWWRNELGAPAAIVKDDMPQGGWTETASLLWVDIDATRARIQAEVDRLLVGDRPEP